MHRFSPLVLEGSVRVAKMAPTGREIVLYRVAPGEGCIIAGSCLLGHSDYSATALAEDDVTVLVIPPPLFQELLLHHEPFRRFVFDMYCARLSEVMELLEEVAFRRLDTRLAQLLIHRRSVIQATHQSIADELGSVRVFVSRLLRNFEQRGWVKLEREKVAVTDLQGLAQFARGLTSGENRGRRRPNRTRQTRRCVLHKVAKVLPKLSAIQPNLVDEMPWRDWLVANTPRLLR